MASTSSVNADEEKKNVEHSNLAIHDENPVMNEKVDDNEEVPDDPATARKKRRLLWKIDLFILPLLVIVYFFGSMGRSDLGNAQVAGMNKELNLSAQDYSNAANTFLVGYIVFQLPGTLLVRKIGPPNQFALAMILWGIFTAVSVCITTPAQLMALRFLIGFAEAFTQGAAFYLSFWYQYKELATRAAIFFSMSTLAGAFNGLIAYAITKNLNGKNGWLAWRWIFLVEGILPIGASFFVLFLLPGSPASTRIGFSAEEKKMAIARSMRSHNNLDEKLNWKKIHTPLISLGFWMMTIIACCGHFCVSSFANFLPAIVNGFGYSAVDTQLFTVIVYACAFVGLIFFGRIADITNQRGLTLAAANAVAVLGYALLLGLTSGKARFAATCVLAFGVYPTIILQISWLTMSTVGYTKRGSSLAFVNIFSQIFSICGNQAYIDPPYYRHGNATSLGLSALAVIVSLLLSWYFRFRNAQKRRDQWKPETAELRQKSFEELGDRHPDFFYMT